MGDVVWLRRLGAWRPWTTTPMRHHRGISEFKYFVIWPKICQVLGKMFQFSGKRVCIWDFFVFLPKAWNFLWKISAKTLPFPSHFCLKFLWQNPLIFPTSSAYKCPADQKHHHSFLPVFFQVVKLQFRVVLCQFLSRSMAYWNRKC